MTLWDKKMAVIMDGKGLGLTIRKELSAQVAFLKKDKGITPGLAAILVGEDAASKMYVSMKRKACQEAGIFSQEFRIEAGVNEAQLVELIERLNDDARFHGILVQLPLPPMIDTDKVLDAVSATKDVDGLHPINVGRLFMGRPYLNPCTPYGVIKLLEHYQVDFPGKVAVVVGRSNIVGRPLSVMLLHRHCTVMVCHTRTRDLAKWTREADILVAAAGRPEMIKGDMIKEGAAVVDVGINRLADGKLVGDVEFASAAQVAGLISPVPGGVGPMTIAMLLSNTVEAAQRQAGFGS